MDWSKIKYFTEDEMRCHCGCGRADMDEEFMMELDNLREICGFPFPVNSGFRCPEYNQRVSNTGPNGPHTTGKAVDIRLSGKEARKALDWAVETFEGIGIAQRGLHESRYLHLDLCEGETRPWIWSY